MKASPLEFRLRVWIVCAIYVLGFYAPWERYTLPHPPQMAWLQVSQWMARIGDIGLAVSTATLTGLVLALAVAGAVLRVWATAYLDGATVHAPEMRGSSVLQSGPYRYLRNPLYLGSWLLTFVLALLMPPTGALFALLALALFFLRLMRGEESYLAEKIGEDYLAYCNRVPRLVPALRAPQGAIGPKPAWVYALLYESYPVLLVLSFAALAWRYNGWLVGKAAIISFGASLVIRALLPGAPRQKARA